jgi:flagellar biosynthesis protein FlhG
MLDHFMKQLEELESFYDFIFLDMGAGVTESALRFILSSHEILVVATPEITSITDAYSMMKFIYSRDKEIPFYLAVNRCESEQEGHETAYKLKNVCKQFLQKELNCIGFVPMDKTVADSVKRQIPFTLYKPSSLASQAVLKLARTFSGASAQQKASYKSFITKLKSLFKER